VPGVWEASFDRKVTWQESQDAEHPYQARIGGAHWVIRINDFPDEPLYTLLIDGMPVLDFDDWPQAWIRPD
jgi:hypothetical protein